MKPWKKTEPKPENEDKTKEEEGDGSGDGEDGSGEPEMKTGLKALRKIDTPARFVLRSRKEKTFFFHTFVFQMGCPSLCSDNPCLSVWLHHLQVQRLHVQHMVQVRGQGGRVK